MLSALVSVLVLVLKTIFFVFEIVKDVALCFVSLNRSNHLKRAESSRG
jgi:hypothetical protein